VIHVTLHAIQRGRERLSLTEAAVIKLAERAYVEGIDGSSAKGRLKKYLSKIDKQVKIRGDILYVFTIYRKQPSLVTLFPLPFEFRKYINRA
jgi:hypothetical protein